MLRFKPFETSSTWQFPDPDNGRLHTGRTRAELVQTITNYRAQNQLEPIEKLDVVLENYLCGLPENVGKCCDAELKRGFIQYLKGGLALVKNIYYGEANMVSQEVADARALICKDCEFNVFPDRDTFIKWSDDIALHSIGDKRSTYHNDLGNCSCCSCPLRAKVWLKGPFSLSKDESLCMLRAKNCWQLKEV